MEKTLFSPSTFYALCDELESLPLENIISVKGSNNILITSVHGHDHLRNNQIKAKDQGTLKFAYLLARITGSHFFGVNQPNLEDSNYYKDTPLKKSILEFQKHNNISLLVDIHASHSCRITDIEFGTMNRQSLLNKDEILESIINKFKGYYFICQVDEIFKGIGQHNDCQTMVRFGTEELQIPSLQCELNASFLIDHENLMTLHRYCQLLNCFAEFVFAHKD